MSNEFQTPAEQDVFEAEPHSTPRWWQQWLGRWMSLANFHPVTTVVMTALLIASIALAAWVVALFLENRFLRTQLAAASAPPQTGETDGQPEEIQSRVEQVQRQLAEFKGQVSEQQAEQESFQKDSLAAENARLIGEVNELSKPQLEHPVVEATPASLMPPPPDKTKESVNFVDVLPNAASFTMLLKPIVELTHPNYLVELMDRRSNKVIWSAQQKSPGKAGFSLTLVKRNYPAGKYRVRITGLNGKKKDPIDTWDLQFNYLTPPASAGKAKGKGK